ncbi:helix-turn-helix transcriptional regulator [Halostella sp. JP-L12]|uniref:ArsR/SmtB family transcription factor n=1 Tax=Halostella TaxID=1843185 RepID=UPI000EF7DF61|nr:MULTISPECIES: winged helix-turn-helix domain-containing protein [Halostella]NHN46279.1 helix-turn-helix transcriptional regulator [Halostella sp. JP-L12]
MADLLPSTSDASAPEDADPRVVGVDSEDADDVLAALSSATARELLAVLHDDPATPSELADAVDTSLQNTQYHLGNLEDAEVVEVVDTIYSEKGREMKVYAPADQPLVLFAGQEEETSTLKSALSRLLGGVGIVGAASVALHRLAGEMAVTPPSSGGSGGNREGGAVGGDADGGEYLTGDDADPGGPNQTNGGEATETATTTTTESGDVGIMNEETTEATRTAEATEYAEEDTVAETAVETTRETATETADAADGTTTVVGDAAEAANDTATSVLDLSGAISPGLVLFVAGTIAVTAWVFFYYVER